MQIILEQEPHTRLVLTEESEALRVPGAAFRAITRQNPRVLRRLKDEMTSLGQGHVHQQRIESEIAERMRELKTLEPYLQQSGDNSAPSYPP